MDATGGQAETAPPDSRPVTGHHHPASYGEEGVGQVRKRQPQAGGASSNRGVGFS